MGAPSTIAARLRSLGISRRRPLTVTSCYIELKLVYAFFFPLSTNRAQKQATFHHFEIFLEKRAEIGLLFRLYQ